MDEIQKFRNERADRIEGYASDATFKQQSLDWLRESMQRMYVYNFDWLGRPIIQYPQDMVGIQELIWQVKPDLIIETGLVPHRARAGGHCPHPSTPKRRERRRLDAGQFCP